MNNLLHAGFTRLRKSKLYIAGVIIMVLLGIILPISDYIVTQKWNVKAGIESYFFSFSLVSTIISSVFCSMFVGTEYSDGTIRNKLIVGHARINIYLSNLILCITGVLFMQFIYMAVTVAIGIPLVGTQGTFKLFLEPVVGVLLMTICFCSLFTLIAMICQNKSITVVICILGMFSLLFFGTYTYSRLSEPEYYEAYTYTEPDGTIVNSPREKNPRYLSGTKRTVYENMLDINPGGQLLQYSEGHAQNLARCEGAAAVITILSTVSGIIVFRKKDIK